jgi:hypothetical protein
MHDLWIGKGGFMIATAQHLIGLEYGGDGFFYRWNIDQLDEFHRFGEKGQGPDEFLRPHALQYLSDSLMGCYDLFAGTFHEIVLPPHPERIKTKTVSFRPERRADFVVKTYCNQYIGIGSYPENMYMLFDSSGYKIKSFFEFPFRDAEEKSIENPFRAMAYQGKIAVNPSGTKFAYAAYNTDIIHFYNIAHSDIQVIKKIERRFCEYVPDDVDGRGVSARVKPDNEYGYIDLYATEQYVYLLYSGKTPRKYREKAHESTQLKIYDWQGNLLKEVTLDVPCKFVCVSPDDETLWAIAEIPEPTIVRFDLTNFIK